MTDEELEMILRKNLHPDVNEEDVNIVNENCGNNDTDLKK